MKNNFRNGFLDDATNKIRDIYKKNAPKAKARKKALGNVAKGLSGKGIAPNPATN